MQTRHFVSFVKNFLAFIFVILFANKCYGQFLSTASCKINARYGPGTEYPIKYQYQKQHLPLFVLQQFEGWVLTKDPEGCTAWIKKDLLSTKKTAITKLQTIGYKKASDSSKKLAKLDKGVVVLIKKCTKNFCNIIVKKQKMWVNKSDLWGL